MPKQHNLNTIELLVDAGVSEAIANTPNNLLKPKKAAAVKPADSETAQAPAPKVAVAAPVVAQSSNNASLNQIIESSRKAAEAANTLEELRECIESFEGCSLKKMANKTVFADGNPTTGVMLIGEAPGAEEDVQGIPFCGASGQLLDKVLKSINLDRKTGFYITNTLFWRPPGNRKPTPEELAICEPFLEKHIALVNPKVLLLVGATAVTGVLKNNESMGKLRKQIFAYKNQYMKESVKVVVTYHPSFLMRSPLNKRLAWEDMLYLKSVIGSN